jgi:hypothetical protein
MRLPWQKRRVERADPNRPHRFKPVSDGTLLGDGAPPAIIAADPSGNAALTGIIVTPASFTDRGCGVCRRPHDDPIHDAED